MSATDYILGIDEAGRGPLAGPVHVGFVLVKHDFDFRQFPNLNDSKQLTEKQREHIAAALQDHSDVQQTVAHSRAQTVDAHGIELALQRAINRGLRRLDPVPSKTKLYLDGRLTAPRRFLYQETVVRGDERIPVISLASVLAKVTRDNHMRRLVQTYPDFSFGQHKGYGTQAHRAEIQKYGPTDVHRMSFLSNFIK